MPTTPASLWHRKLTKVLMTCSECKTERLRPVENINFVNFISQNSCLRLLKIKFNFKEFQCGQQVWPLCPCYCRSFSTKSYHFKPHDTCLWVDIVGSSLWWEFWLRLMHFTFVFCQVFFPRSNRISNPCWFLKSQDWTDFFYYLPSLSLSLSIYQDLSATFILLPLSCPCSPLPHFLPPLLGLFNSLFSSLWIRGQTQDR